MKNIVLGDTKRRLLGNDLLEGEKKIRYSRNDSETVLGQTGQSCVY